MVRKRGRDGRGDMFEGGMVRFDWLAGGVPKRGVEGEEISLIAKAGR